MKIPELPKKKMSANELLAIPGMESLFARFDDDLLYLGESPKTNAEALLVSLVKWALTIKYGMRSNGGEQSCGLCMMYISDECFECPIYAITSVSYCRETPFEQWGYARDDSTRARHAREEYNFLWSLAERVRSNVQTHPTEMVSNGEPLLDVTSIEVDCGDGITMTYYGGEDQQFVKLQDEVMLTGKYEQWPNIRLEIAKIVGWGDEKFVKHDGWK